MIAKTTHDDIPSEIPSLFRLEFVGLIAYLFIILFSPQENLPWLASLRPALTVAVLTAIAAVVNRVSSEHSLHSRMTVQSWLLIALSILFPISVFVNMDVFYAIPVELLGFFKLVALYFLITAVLKSQRDVTTFIKFIVLFTSIIAVYSLLTYKFKWGEVEYRMSSPFGGMGSNSNGFAMLLLGVMPFAFFFFFQTDSLPKKCLLAFIVICILTCVVKTRSRMGFMTVLIQLPLILWYAKLRRRSVLIVVICLTIPIIRAHENLWDRVATIRTVDPQVTIWSAARQNKWRQAGILIKKYPLTGVGQTRFRDAVRRHNLGEHEHVVHNAYLEIGAEAGIPAMIAFVGLILAALKKTWRSPKTWGDKGQSTLVSISWALFVAIFSYAFCLAFLSEQYNSMLFVLLGLSTSVARLTQTDLDRNH